MSNYLENRCFKFNYKDSMDWLTVKSETLPSPRQRHMVIITGILSPPSQEDVEEEIEKVGGVDSVIASYAFAVPQVLDRVRIRKFAYRSEAPSMQPWGAGPKVVVD